MELIVGIAIAVSVIAVIALALVLAARSGNKRAAKVAAYATQRGFQFDGGDPNRPTFSGTKNEQYFSAVFDRLNLSAAPIPGRSVPGMFALEILLRAPVRSERTALVSRPFFRDAIHLPPPGLQPTSVGDPAFEGAYRVLVRPGEAADWLDANVRAAMPALDARELRIAGGEVTLSLRNHDADPARLDRALELLLAVASRV